MDLSIRNIEYCKGVGTKRADTLRHEWGVKTALDILYQFPYKYIDRSRYYFIDDIPNEDTYVQIIGHITEWHSIGKGGTQRISATFTDGRSQIELVWFQNIRYLKLEIGVQYLLFGKPSLFNHQYNFVHPELTPWQKVTEVMNGLEPSYSLTEKMRKTGFTHKVIRTIMASLLPDIPDGVSETLNEDIRDQYHLVPIAEALTNIHFPKDQSSLKQARERLKFEELFYIQLRILKQKTQREQAIGYKMPIVGKTFHHFYQHCLPFELTNAQKRVMREIFSDMKSGHQMNRLLQGDVGSGKTLVALMAMLLAIDNGYQACIMAPTEILADQHMATLTQLLANTDVRVALLTGSTTKKQRITLHQDLQSGRIQILIGTHALIEDDVVFANLGLCIIDEQHRFGVAQRAKLWGKNICPPHVLVMTATPIPRTLAMTVFGDLSSSTIDELPPGRKPVITMHYAIEQRSKVNQFITQQVEEGRQIYVVYPLIKENENTDLRDLETGYRQLCQTFPQYRISIVHGKMASKDKEAQMHRFVAGETQILVATTVIEVGVNVPNATVMIIENAERFGLSQLHQLRGRVGRGAARSYCLLLTRMELTKDTRMRMDIMVETNNGFRIADADMHLRGPGNMAGTQQSGALVDLHIANLTTDGPILEMARTAANKVLEQDPKLEHADNRLYKQRIEALQHSTADWGDIS